MTQIDTDPGILYILTNEKMPGLVKIGLTRGDLRTRLRSLDTTGTPWPFDVYHASKVSNILRTEKLIHRIFAGQRVRSNREFFEIDPDQATAAALLIEEEDVTQSALEEAVEALDTEGRAALTSNRRKTANFQAAGLNPGTEITYTRDSTIKATVSTDRLVCYQGEEYSLSTLTKILMKTLENRDGSYNGWEYWRLRDQKLSDIWRNIQYSQNKED